MRSFILGSAAFITVGLVLGGCGIYGFQLWLLGGIR